LKPNPEILDRRFLWRWLLSYDVLEYVTALQTGVKMPRLRTGDLEAMLVPLPPLPEQHCLVEKIERLFAESRTAREALERVPALLKRFRQAVLAKAFRGDLTPGVGGEGRAFLKSGWGAKEQIEGMIGMGIVVALGLRGIGVVISQQ
jgi:type I restriction enzyme S subunit